MALEFKLPELGENVVSGTVAKLLVSEGETIKENQAVIELETDKAVIEVPSTISGLVQKILVEEGSDVKVGQTVLVLADGGEKGPKEAEEKEKPKVKETDEKTEKTQQEKVLADEKILDQNVETNKKEVSVIEFTLPELGESVQSGTVTKLYVSAGDTIKKDQNVLELETEKAVIEVPSSLEGKILEMFVQEGDLVQVGQRIFSVAGYDYQIEKTLKSPRVSESEKVEELDKIDSIPMGEEKDESAPRMTMPIYQGAAPAAPSVRRLAREIGIDIDEVEGSGPEGRISIEDVKNYSKILNQKKAVSGGSLPVIGAEKLPDFSKWGEITREPMSKVRETTARHLSYAWSTIPHVTQFDKANIAELERLRKKYAKIVEEQGGKLTVTAVILKIIGVALKVFPQFNASIDLDKFEIIYKKYYNIGIAVDTNRGLLVPVVRNVEKKNIIELSVELTQIAEKARSAKLSLEDMQGGNFTISNLGGIGGTGFAPVVNSPEVAILGISRSQIESIYIDGEFKPLVMLPLSLSYDHRIIDGADAARFLRWVCEAIEQPFKLIIEG